MRRSALQRGHLITGVLTTATVIVAAFIFLAANALAISAPIQIANTGGEGVNIRAEPTVNSTKLGWMPEGTSPDYNCFVWGEDINGVPIWFNVNYGGVTGYYASYYDNSSYHSNEELTAKYGIPLCGSTPPPSPPPPPPPPPPTPTPPTTLPGDGNLVFTIYNAEGGIYYRTGPHWNETTKTPGVGVYNGDEVELVCGASGDPIGPYNNTAWSKVRNLTRPSIGEGWVNEHYINDGAASGSWPAGEPMCGGSGGSSGSGSGTSSPANTPKSVFFWPQLEPTKRPSGVPWQKVSDHDFDYPEWAAGNCSPLKVGGLDIPASVNTLAGWSQSRLALVYFLDVASQSQIEQIHTMILFDPGNLKDFAPASEAEKIYDAVTGKDSTKCDWQYPVGSLFASWVSNPANQLIVLTGKRSEDEKFAGLWRYYFPEIWNQPFAYRVSVCDYPGMSHEDIIKDFWEIVKDPPVLSCPAAPGQPPPFPWNP